MRDDIQPKGLMISTTLRAVMIYQVCDLDKKILQKTYPFLQYFLVRMKGLAPLRYHAGVANDGCPSFVADMPSLIAVCLRCPPVQVPYVLRTIKNGHPCWVAICYGADEGT